MRALSDSDNNSLVTFTFSEAVTDFDNADVTVAGGTLGTLTSGDGGVTWTATFTATDGFDDHRLGDGDAGGYTDAVGNIGGGGTDTVAIDTRTRR